MTAAADAPGMDDALRAAVAALRTDADPRAQRAHVWKTVRDLVGGGEPRFEAWPGEGALHAPGDEPRPGAARGMRGFSRPADAGGDAHGLGAPVVTYTLYNPAAFAHIRRHGLQRREALERLRGGGRDAAAAFPEDAVVVKTAWWPVAASGLTAMPVWDAADNPAAARGNPYMTWTRVVAVDPAASAAVASPSVAIAFMGRDVAGARRVALSAFHHLVVDARMAASLSRDAESRRAAALALGRPIAAGDYLALVGLNLMTHEQADWVWAALWWHDRPGEGPFAADRPAGLAGPWSNYLMQAAFDAETPAAADGGPHICFNPWLEARFPDGGQGAGVDSNCLACHRRASYPAAPFLPVTRGAGDPADPALAGDRVATRFMWSLALHAR